MTNKNEIELQPKDGKVHVMYVKLNCAKKGHDVLILSNNKVETITNFIQDKGYEIVDIKFANEGEPFYFNSVLIMYK